MQRLRALTGLMALMMTIPATGLAGEFQVSVYGGDAWTTDTDVEINRPGGTNLRFDDVAFDSESFEAPIYYGARLAYWPDPVKGLGILLDFTHAKIIADLDQTVDVAGTDGGVAVNSAQQLSERFGNLEFSHGHNILTANLAHRWTVAERLRPYVGGGVGIAIPHVEITIDGSSTSNYQAAGPAFQALAGLDFRLIGSLSAFGEYKFTYARLDADLDGGGSIEVEPLTHHLAFGFALGWSF